MEAASSSLFPGFRLDRYELLCPIASGGMASVWLARLRGKRGFEKLFAIKTIKTELISDPHFQEMFLDEARIASRIIHPNVAQILELGEQDDILYIVMEYVDGDSVAKISRLALKRGTPLPAGISLRIVAETCGGLHAAHQLKDSAGESLGVVHRDVSPQNILLTTEGSTKVIDFGLVKAKNRSAVETGQGVVKGKIRYMAPEQVTSKGVDHRADIWAAGMCLYELLVGHTPFHTEDDLEVVKRLMSPDPLPRIDIELALPIKSLLERALARDPADRFDSCSQMRRAIEAVIHELDLPAENEHVAEFLATNLPELASTRATTIARATDSAEARVGHAGSLDILGPADIAFAATEVVSRNRAAEEDDPLPPTRRHGKKGDRDEARETTTSNATSHLASSTSLRAQLGERKRRGGAGLWLTAFVVAGVGGWLLWPRAIDPSAPAALDPTIDAAAATDPALLPDTEARIDDDLEALVDAGAAASAIATSPTAIATGPTTSGVSRSPVVPPPSAASAAPAAPTYNPAWSILTNPPEAGVAPPPTSSVPPTPTPTQTPTQTPYEPRDK